ncbi:ribonuclease T2 family protein [Methylocella silvestris]|uniref:Ribonuclease T n=1 Tax=Methylocella silvestris TaxID=199596 RepID=A0A2J7TCX8_METSI|nr:ribonuclease T2 [Methylocella silvestris]PNG24609.1 ribonuclease T [Methylocella silvestris]
MAGFRLGARALAACLVAALAGAPAFASDAAIAGTENCALDECVNERLPQGLPAEPSAAAPAPAPSTPPTPAVAGAEDCVLDECAGPEPSATPPQADAPATAPFTPAAAAPAYRRSANAPGDFDFYVLALSWSPGFCRTAAAERAGRQCAPGAGLGFLVHGLWPQYERGYPQNCPLGASFPSRIALQNAAGVYPSESLARYEWRKHGVCSGRSPTDYFADVRRAREAIVIPPPFANPALTQTSTSIDIERAFIAANPRLRPGMIGVSCQQSALQEVRLCLSKDLRDFHACPEISRRHCPIGQIAVPPAL